jgi:hypothetical protein
MGQAFRYLEEITVSQRKVTLAVPNGVVFIGDRDLKVPDVTGVGQFWTSRSCVAVATENAVEGATTFTLSWNEISYPGEPPAFDMAVDTPGKIVVLSTSEAEEIFELPISEERTRIRIWLNRSVQADEVRVAIG